MLTPRHSLNTFCLVAYMHQIPIVSTITSETGSQLVLASTSSSGLLGRGSEKIFNECLRVSNAVPYHALVNYHHEVANIQFKEVNRESCSVSSLEAITNELYSFAKGSEIGLGLPIDSTVSTFVI